MEDDEKCENRNMKPKHQKPQNKMQHILKYILYMHAMKVPKLAPLNVLSL
jgi:hypothetical protein